VGKITKKISLKECFLY